MRPLILKFPKAPALKSTDFAAPLILAYTVLISERDKTWLSSRPPVSPGARQYYLIIHQLLRDTSLDGSTLQMSSISRNILLTIEDRDFRSGRNNGKKRLICFWREAILGCGWNSRRLYVIRTVRFFTKTHFALFFDILPIIWICV
jgi:hypothetical protein